MSLTRSRGFTLFELVIVLAIVGILLGLVTLVPRDDSRQEARAAAAALAQDIRHAQQRAMLQGRDQGIRFTRQGYVVMSEGHQGWRQEGPYHHTGLALKLIIDGLPVDTHPSGEAPQLVVASSDAGLPFEVHFSAAGVRLASVAGDGLNDPHVQD